MRKIIESVNHIKSFKSMFFQKKHAKCLQVEIGLYVSSNLLVSRWIIAFVFYFCASQKGEISCFSPEAVFYNTSKPNLKECVNSVIKLSDLSSKSKSLQANYYLDRGDSLSNVYI